MYSNTSFAKLTHVSRTTGWGFWKTQKSYSEQQVDGNITSFTVTNGLVQGNRKKPNPIAYTKVAYVAGLGRKVWEEIRNGSVSNYPAPGYTDVQGGLYGAQFPVMEAAGTVGPNSSVPLNKGWGYYDSNRSVVRDRALAKVFSELRSGPNLIVDLAEGGSTLRMLKGTLRFRSVLKDFFKELVIPRKLRGASAGQRRLDYMTSKWLEYRYGWSPLVMSIYDAFDQLNREIQTDIKTIKARSSHYREGSFAEDTSGFNPTSHVTAPAVGARSTTWTWSKQHKCEYSIRFAPQGQQIWDWTALNPLSIAWELLPLSFVADWLIGMGTYLETLENSAIYSRFFLDGYRTDVFIGACFKKDTYWAANTSDVRPNTSLVRSVHYNSKNAGFVKVEKTRTILTSLPFPEGVHLKVNLNAKRQLDAAALIHQLVGRRFR